LEIQGQDVNFNSSDLVVSEVRFENMPVGTLHKDEYWNYILMVLKVTQVTAGAFCLAE
jgi:hypothetical protein